MSATAPSTPDGEAQEPSAAMRGRIIDATRALIVEKGYAGASTAAILRSSGVSRGGLYHHFSGKSELFAAVLEAVERDLMERLAAVVQDAPDPLAALETGVDWYLDECMRSIELQRVALVEGRKALGWEAWRATVSPFGLSMLSATLAAAMEAGTMRPADPDALAYLLLAALHEASAIVASAEDAERERELVGGAVAALISGLRTR